MVPVPGDFFCIAPLDVVMSRFKNHLTVRQHLHFTNFSRGYVSFRECIDVFFSPLSPNLYVSIGIKLEPESQQLTVVRLMEMVISKHFPSKELKFIIQLKLYHIIYINRCSKFQEHIKLHSKCGKMMSQS